MCCIFAVYMVIISTMLTNGSQTGLKAQLNQAQKEQEDLNHQADLTKVRLERAGKLTSALADEGIRWDQTAEKIRQDTELLVGDVFISSACIAYYGAFTGPYRYWKFSQVSASQL